MLNMPEFFAVMIGSILSVEYRFWFPFLHPKRRRPPISGVGGMLGLLVGSLVAGPWSRDSRGDSVGTWLLGAAAVGLVVEMLVREWQTRRA